LKQEAAYLAQYEKRSNTASNALEIESTPLVFLSGMILCSRSYSLLERKKEKSILIATFSFVQDLPKLSPVQQKLNAVWRRLENRHIYEPGKPLRAAQVVQKAVSDCSVCASISLCINHQERFVGVTTRTILRS
jgi:hypothetical protein